MNQRVREHLINIAARGGTITYQKLSDECALKLDMQASQYDRAEIGRILGEISTFEHIHGRPLISAVVITKGTGYEGDGFFKLAQELGFGPWKKLRDSDFDIVEIKKCFEFWRNAENFSKI
jgi:hypothetical protein